VKARLIFKLSRGLTILVGKRSLSRQSVEADSGRNLVLHLAVDKAGITGDAPRLVELDFVNGHLFTPKIDLMRAVLMICFPFKEKEKLVNEAPSCDFFLKNYCVTSAFFLFFWDYNVKIFTSG